MEQVKELAQITLFLAKPGETIESVLDDGPAPLTGRSAYTEARFEVGNAFCTFIYFESVGKLSSPVWLEFANLQLPNDEQISFRAKSRRPNGILLIEVEGQILIGVFGRSALSYVKKGSIEPEFGIKTAMNMCGNEEIRQTRTQSHAITTTHIDRQVSRPSDTFVFGLSESEDLRFISAHLKGERSITLQGRDSLTLRIVGEKKLSWEELISRCEEILVRFRSDDYVKLFPNFRNFKPASEEEVIALDACLLESIVDGDLTRLTLSIPEFLADEDVGFSFSARKKRNNNIYAYLDSALLPEVLSGSHEISVEELTRKKIYAYSFCGRSHRCPSSLVAL